MQIRQEQIVFALTLLAVGALFSSGGGDERPSRRARGDAPELDRYGAPDTDRLTSLSGVEAGRRALLSPPRDTRPLDPLAFRQPPMPAIPALSPPPAPGPAPAYFARLLQVLPEVDLRPGLFEQARGGVLDETAELVDELEALGYAQLGENSSVLDQLSSLGYGGSGSVFEVENEFLDAEERRQREAAYYRLYDWVRVGEAGLKFGRIENEDPYSLREPGRALEVVLFRQYDPETGEPSFGGAPPIPYERERVVDFGLAQTVGNELRQTNHDLAGEVGPAMVGPMLEFGERCLEARLEFPEGLALAEQVHRRLDAAFPADPRAAVGLARTLEARFDFEAAFELYESLLERFPVSAEVHAGLAGLEQQFRLFDAAEAHLRRAVAVDRSSPIGHAALGRFLLERGRLVEARDALTDALNRAPGGADGARMRLAVRLDLGAARLALGEIVAAGRVFRDAASAERSSQPALAGLVACALLGDGASESALPDWLRAGDPPPADDFEAAGYELLLASGLWSAADGDHERAVRSLYAAAAADPLRCAPALRALAWIAERTGDGEIALEEIENALAADPTDVWAHYQHGRLLLARDELEDAGAAFRRALQFEADFEDALVGLGLVAWREGSHADAELYFERAAGLAAARIAEGVGLARPDLHALRGLNLIELGEYLGARAAFETALEVDARYPLASAGLAWTTYRLGDTAEALIQLRSIDDMLRERPESDPMRVWAREEIERLSLHESMDVWLDEFEYSKLGNGWSRREAAGPQAALESGELVLSGNFKTIGEVRFERLYEASKFVSIQARVKVSGDSNARAGLFVSRETGRGDRTRIQAYAAIARSRDGAAQVRTIVPGKEGGDWIDLPPADFPFPADEWMTLAVERRGEGSDTTVAIYLEGIPVLEGLPMTNLARGNDALQVGLFAEGDTGRRVEVRMDDVEVVRMRGDG
jgi:tetratricopeptide (TPR) repeat protein